MSIHSLAHSEKEELGEVSISEIFHDYPEGISYFVYAEGQVFDADITPAGDSSARLTVRDNQRKNRGAIVVENVSTFNEIDETAQFFADSWA